MDSVLVAIVVPGITALLLLLVFSYLYQQSRESYFRAWQLAWAALCVYYAIQMWQQISGQASATLFFLAQLCQAAIALAIFASTRMTDGEHYQFRWYDGALAAAGAVLAVYNTWAHYRSGNFTASPVAPRLELDVLIAVLLLYCAVKFFRAGRQRDSIGFQVLGFALAVWALLMWSQLFHGPLENWLGDIGHFLGPMPQMLMGIAMVIVLFEGERRKVQENALYFSTLDVDNKAVIGAGELTSSFHKLLDRLCRVLKVDQAAICTAEGWRSTLPTVAQGFPAGLMPALDASEADEYLIDLAYRRGGLVTVRGLPSAKEPMPAGQPGRFARLKEIAGQYGIANVTAVSLQTREKNFGVLLFLHRQRDMFGPSQLRLLTGLSTQIAMTLENHVAIQETQRKTREYELLTQMGQVISSRLNSDEVLLAIHKEIGLLVDTDTFYVAFLQGEDLRFELEVEQGEVLPKRMRKTANGLSEYVIRAGQPLLVKSGMEEVRARIGATHVPGRPAQSFCGVPIFMGGRSVGVMAAMNYEHEFVYSERDVDLMQTAAGQVAVAVENARLFEEQQRRARYLGFLNTVSKTAISSEDAEQMLAEIVAEIQKNFLLDHIGIGMLDYATKEIEIKAAAGTAKVALGRRDPLGAGIMGRVARTGEMVLVQGDDEGHMLSILPGAKSVLCLPLTYGETLLGVLDVESRREHAFGEQDVLILRTLADLLATALHNAFVFQKLQQQSITDGLTGIKTRRFFLESVSAEWKRASRSGRPFSVVMVDLDKFKDVNDSMGHLEGDLVLARVGRLLEQKCRQSNVVARYGGDEFVILMPETGIEQAQILSERLRLWIATDPMLNERHITGSFGVASFPLHGSTVEDIVRVSDAGMYVSKHAGGNRVSTAEEFKEGETIAVQRQLVASYIEGFLQREHMGPESADELVATLRKMCSGLQDDPEPMKEAILALTRAAEAREVYGTGHG
ncbi:MAG TPA: diguanylate cyclase, partial [Terriglobales bacterium]|nr:diguanylate cyclase [Terriglobales bacterium]